MDFSDVNKYIDTYYIEGEIWKSCKGMYPNGENFEVSNFGRVRTVARTVTLSTGRKCQYKSRIRKLCKDTNGYLYVPFGKVDGGGRCYARVHRLVAMAFIPNPNNLPEVNHKNEIRTFNAEFNLEWCTHEYNSNYGSHGDNIRKAICTFIVNIETGMIFAGGREAERIVNSLGGYTDNSGIFKNIKGKIPHCGKLNGDKLHWRKATEYEKQMYWEQAFVTGGESNGKVEK